MSNTATFPVRVRLFSQKIDELFERLGEIDGKAEVVDGRFIVKSPPGVWPNYVASRIFVHLDGYVRRCLSGFAVSGKSTFNVDLPHRKSFSPDAAYFVGPKGQMGPFEGASVFAVEVRSIGNYGPCGERLAAEKRADYFACGTKMVWWVDLLTTDVVKVYRADAPDQATIYRPGDIAEAEPAVPGWTVPVNDILPEDWQPPAESREG